VVGGLPGQVSRYTTISIPPRVKKELSKLRRELNTSSWGELLEKLVKAYRELQELNAEREVKQLMCNDFRETQASLPAWGKLLASRLRDPDKIYTAMKYLKLNQSGDYVVDESKCA
jgi:hypothetical protein